MPMNVIRASRTAAILKFLS